MKHWILSNVNSRLVTTMHGRRTTLALNQIQAVSYSVIVVYTWSNIKILHLVFLLLYATKLLPINIRYLLVDFLLLLSPTYQVSEKIKI